MTVGSVDGILTAAHVLENLPDHGEVGIVLFNRTSRFAQKLTIDMEQAEKLTIAADVFGPSDQILASGAAGLTGRLIDLGETRART